jgi:hypothetical protein
MNLKAAFLDMAAAGAFLLLAACGGGDSGSPISDRNSSSGNVSATASNGGSIATFSPTIPAPMPGSVSGSWSTRRCSPLPQTTTIVGGALFVAEQGPVGLTLLSDGGLNQSPGIPLPNGTLLRYEFWLAYDNVFGLSGVSNPQDKWGVAGPFPSGTPVGTSMQVELQPPHGVTFLGSFPSTFPKGIPLELTLDKPPVTGAWAHSSTAGIDKDMADDEWHRPHNEADTASVTYGPNNTATVTFFAGTDGPHFSVGLTNVCGSGLRNPLPVAGVRDLAFDSASGQILAFRGAAGSGVYIDPVTGRLGATFSGFPEPNGSSNTTTAADAEGRTFTLTPTTTPSVWTLSSSTGTSITLSDMQRGLAGTDTILYGSLIRYGTRGLAFRIVLPWAGDYVYLVESPALIP